MSKMFKSIFKSRYRKSSNHFIEEKRDEKSDAVETDENSNIFLDSLQQIVDKDSNRKELLAFCEQDFLLEFQNAFSQSVFKELVRFDCGSYAELFRGFDNKIQELVVLKVIRVVSSELKRRVSGPVFRTIATFEDVYSEFQISAALSSLRQNDEFETNCFPRVFDKLLVLGHIPEYFLKDKPSEALKSIRDDPFEDFVSIPREHAVIVMAFGGTPLWKAMNNRTISALQLSSVVKQVTLGLAIAEAAFEFEHRDLHISNILVKETLKTKIHFIHGFNRYYVDSEGFEATIIDTTFSRIKINNRIFHKDLTSIMRFDENTKLSSQDRVYKSMVRLTKKEWNRFRPKTNIKWLSYLCQTILKSKVMTESDDYESELKIKEISKIILQKRCLQKIDFNAL